MYDLHIHSNFSDGKASIDEIAKRAKEIGLKAIAIVDHSSEHKLGLNERKAKAREVEIEKARSKYDIEILSGVECGILPEGKILIPKFKFDIILIAVHEVLPKEEYYRRVKLCLTKNNVDVLSHFHSQMFCTLDGRDVERDVEILDMLKDGDVALELNSLHEAPPLDLVKKASEIGVAYSIGSDSHSLQRVGDVEWCRKIARKYFPNSKFII